MSGIFIPFGLDPLLLSFTAFNVTPANTFVTLTGNGFTAQDGAGSDRSSSLITYNSVSGAYTGPAGTYLTVIKGVPGYALATAATWHWIPPANRGGEFGSFDNSIAGDGLSHNMTLWNISNTSGNPLNAAIQLRCTTANILGPFFVRMVRLST